VCTWVGLDVEGYTISDQGADVERIERARDLTHRAREVGPGKLVLGRPTIGERGENVAYQRCLEP